jgi:capsular exopolysaccharide synthesis family protein
MTDNFRRTDRSSHAAAAPLGDGALGIDREGSDIDLAKYLRIASKHRFVILGAFMAALMVGLALTLLSTRIYTASATLQIDRQATQVLNNVADVAPAESMIQGEEFFQTQYGLLRSRSLTERVIDTLGLAASDAFLNDMGVDIPRENDGSARARARRRRELVVRTVQDNFSVAPVRGSRLVAISFDSPDPNLSARVVNGFAEGFIQSNLDRRLQSTEYLRDFLEDRIAQTKSRLEDAERQLVAYAGQQEIINFSDGSGPNAQQESLVSRTLAALNASLAEARADRIAAEARWRQANSSALMNLPEVLQNTAVLRLSEERARVSAQYQQNLGIYQPDYPEMQQLSRRLAELDSEIAAFGARVRASIRTQYQVAASEERALQNQVNALKGDVLDLRNRSIQYNILQREVDTSRTLYDGLLQRYKEVGVAGGVTANNVSIVDRAQAPSRPSKPSLMINIGIAGLLGLALGLLAALILEALDETLEKPEDVEQKLGLPVLGVVPLLDKGVAPTAALADVRSAFSEAYYSIRTALQFSTPSGAPASLLITSSRPAEGKSTTAYAIALNLARIGRRVLLADGDLRNPSMHRAMGVENDAGMSNLLSGAGELSALVKSTKQEGLDFIPCGPLPPNPAELWGGDGLRRLLATAAGSYDHVVIDGPPVLGFADAPLLASAVDGAVLVVESKSTRRAQARGALRRLIIGDTHLLGAVLTKFNVKTTRYGGYDYAYDYTYGGSEGGAAPGRKASRR